MSIQGPSNGKDRSSFIAIVLFLALTLATTILSQHLLTAAGSEIYDVAANSILIQDAKHFRLLLGNYSRVGFNHPGPAILYVLAAGEFAFYDLLGWVHSPVAGQMLGMFIYNSFWLSLSYYLLTRMGIEKLVALLSIVVFICVSALFNNGTFNFLWFPYLYVMPFACFLIALAAALGGRTSSLIAVALSSGFLINGHVSFAALCGLTIVLSVVFKTLEVGPRTAWQTAIRDRRLRRDVLTAIAVLALFFVPLAIREVLYRPGPIEQYISYSKHNSHHSWAQSVSFLVMRWAKSPLQSIAMLFVAASFIVICFSPIVKNFRWVIISAMIAVLIYIRNGVDELVYSYVVIFSDAIPALCCALAAAAVAGYLRGLGRSAFMVAAGLPMLWIWAVTVHQSAQDVGVLNDPDVAKFDSAWNSLGAGPFTVDFVGGGLPIFRLMPALEIYRMRHSEPLNYCLADGWHILYTERVHCTEDSPASSLLVQAAKVPRPPNVTASVRVGDLAVYRFGCLLAGQPLNVAKEPDRLRSALRKGWSAIEPGFVWSEDRNPRLVFCVGDDVKRVKLHVSAFVPLPQSTLTITPSVDGMPMPAVHLDYDHSAAVLDLATRPHPSGTVSITLSLDHTTSPEESYGAPDKRQLGIALSAIDAE